MQYQLIRSRRKTLCIEIREGRLLVRAPFAASEAEIRSFLERKSAWIRTRLEQSVAREEAKKNVRRLSADELRLLADQASALFPQRVSRYAGLLGVSWNRITIRAQRTRWGSCSSKGNLNFNCLLMLAPREALDSVVVHELCHRKFMNHSPAFYAEVLRVFPDYRKWDRWLKENGPALLARL